MRRVGVWLVAIMVPLLLAVPALARDAAWQGLQIPSYPGASHVYTDIEADEYELYFQSSHGSDKVFAFYRSALEKQGFRTIQSRQTRTGYKAKLIRGEGGPGDRIELDVKISKGRHKVEIEFDD